MKEMLGIKNEFDSLAKKLNKPEEIGTVELGKIFEELKNLDSKANISANSFARNPQNDMNEVREVLNIWSDLREEVRLKLIEAQNHRNAKLAVLNAKFAEYRKVKGYKKENQKSIKEHEFELDKHKALLNHISDPFAKENMQDTIRDDEKHITNCKLLNNRYDNELANLESVCKTLLNGGKLKENDLVEEEEMIEEIDRDSINKKPQVEKKAEVITPVEEPETIKPLDTFAAREREEEDPFINPFNTEPIEVPYQESTPHEEPDFMFMPPEEFDESEPKPAEGWEDIVPDFFQRRDEGLNVNPPKKVEQSAKKNDLPPAFEVEKPARDEKPAKKSDLPPAFEVEEPARDEKPAKKSDLPPAFEVEEPARDEKPVSKRPLPAPFEINDLNIDEDLDEEKTPVPATVVQPKSTLWSKIGNVINNAKSFLSRKSSTQNTEKIKKAATVDKPKATDLNVNTKEAQKLEAPAFDQIEQAQDDWFNSLTASGLNK